MRQPLLSLCIAGLVACHAEPTGAPPVSPQTPSILFTNECGFRAAFEISLDGGLSRYTVLSPVVDTLVVATFAGRHEISYFALSLAGEVLNLADDTLTVRGPTPYRLFCALAARAGGAAPTAARRHLAAWYRAAKSWTGRWVGSSGHVLTAIATVTHAERQLRQMARGSGLYSMSADALISWGENHARAALALGEETKP